MIISKFPDGTFLLVFDPDTTDILLKGEVVPVPELNIAIGYVKDSEFVEREMDKAKNSFTPRQLGQLLDAANRRKEARRGKVGKNSSANVTGIQEKTTYSI